MTHPDWQQIVDWDGPAVINDSLKGSPYISAVVSVQNWAALVLRPSLDNVNGQWVLNLLWFTAQSGGALIAQRAIVIDASIGAGGGGGGTFVLPNLGPFVQIQATRLTGTSTLSALVIGTNRRTSWEAIPGFQVYDKSGAGVAPGANSIQYPDDYMAGPATLAVNGLTSSFFVVAEYARFQSGTYAQFAVFQVASGSNNVFRLTLPLGAWRVRSNNSGAAAGNYAVQIVPDDTGVG